MLGLHWSKLVMVRGRLKVRLTLYKWVSFRDKVLVMAIFWLGNWVSCDRNTFLEVVRQHCKRSVGQWLSELLLNVVVLLSILYIGTEWPVFP